MTLLKCYRVGKRLNFLYIESYATTPEAKHQVQNQHSISEEMPEFVSIFPFPASLYVQAKFLASVIHRIHRFLLARELRLSIAQSCSWSAALESPKILEPRNNSYFILYFVLPLTSFLLT